MRKFFALIGPACLALGCGSEVIIGDASGTTGAGGATASSSVVTTSATTSTTTFATTTTVSTGVGGAPACNDPDLFVDVQGSDGTFNHFDASCMPEGHLVWPGGASPPPPPGPPPPPVTTYMQITACPYSQTGPYFSVGAGWMSWPGFAANASVTYAIGGTSYSEIPTQTGVLQVDSMEMVGGVITGTFKAMIGPLGSTTSTLEIYGKFRVCRTPDQIPV